MELAALSSRGRARHAGRADRGRLRHPHISTGEMFRAAIDAEDGELGHRVEPILAAGELVPDDLAVELIRERLDQPDARGASSSTASRGTGSGGGARRHARRDRPAPRRRLLLRAPDAIALERLWAGRVTEGRTDDTPEVIARRLAIYHEQTEPLVEYYRARDRLVPFVDRGRRRGLR